MEKNSLFKTMDSAEFDADWRTLHKGQVSLFIMAPLRAEEKIIRREEVCFAQKNLLMLSTPEGTLTAGMFGRKLVAAGTGAFEEMENDSITAFISCRKKQNLLMLVNRSKKTYAFFNSRNGLPKNFSAIIFCSNKKHAILCTAIQLDSPEITPICITSVEEKDVANQFLQLAAAF